MKNPFAKKIKKDDLKLVGLLNDFDINHVLDVGANVGQYATSLRNAGYNRKITSIEPLTSNNDILNAKSKSDTQWIIAPRMAVGDERGEVDINISEHNDMSSILDIEPEMVNALPKSHYVSTETVGVETIDTIIDGLTGANENIFLKVDTQGFEHAVIQGAKNALKNGKIIGVQLELSLLPLYKGEKTYDDICMTMRDFGFETYQIIPGYFSKTIKRQLQADFVFFKSPSS